MSNQSYKNYKELNNIYCLTKREHEILDLIFEEKSNKEIADTLGISVKTVEAHKYNLSQKAGTDNPVALIKLAFRLKLCG